MSPGHTTCHNKNSIALVNFWSSFNTPVLIPREQFKRYIGNRRFLLLFHQILHRGHTQCLSFHSFGISLPINSQDVCEHIKLKDVWFHCYSWLSGRFHFDPSTGATFVTLTEAQKVSFFFPPPGQILVQDCNPNWRASSLMTWDYHFFLMRHILYFRAANLWQRVHDCSQVRSSLKRHTLR